MVDFSYFRRLVESPLQASQATGERLTSYRITLGYLDSFSGTVNDSGHRWVDTCTGGQHPLTFPGQLLVKGV